MQQVVARAARARRRADRGHGGGARRDRRGARPRPGALHRRPPRRGRARPGRARAGGGGARALRPRRPPRRAVRRRPSARTRTRSCSSARAPLLDDDVVVVLAGHPEPYDARAARAAPPSSASRTACASPDYVPDAELEALWRIAGVRRVPDPRRGLRAAGAGGAARAACRWRARDLPGAARGRRRRARTFAPDDPARAAAAITAALRRRRRRRDRRPGVGGRASRGRRPRAGT